jgi:hypothetical protein
MEEQIKFYEWLLKIGNIYLNDNERMVRAFEIINQNN